MRALQKKLFLVALAAALGTFAFVVPAFAARVVASIEEFQSLGGNHNETLLRDED